MKKKLIIIGTLLLLMSLVFTFLIAKVDLRVIKPEIPAVGFSTINSKLTFDYNETIYKISEYLGYVALLIPVCYALYGFTQLVKGKSFKKVDKELYVLAGFYAIVLALYIIFDKLAINYRPVILDEGLEASFPSSHTLMSLCFTISAIIVNKTLFKDKFKVLNVLLIILGIAIVLTRYISGVHWFTDIVGSILISSTLLTYFKAILKK
jgi:undecaprenyl-diphosphatase